MKIASQKLTITFEGFESKEFDPFDLIDKMQTIKPVEGDSFAEIKSFRDNVIGIPEMTMSQAISALAGLKTFIEESKKNIPWMRTLQESTAEGPSQA